ncbi:type A chloramphenicol O-acetyltransferase [Cohnella zeiphila]|uniref:Chloramphenicol acetyltransferase n=1 Tax=Cohnella zeiphila TaxID=2761120 RepID=A0A7X0SM23_9BACL|nr:type A chloramphenicol O-acetyltransferase [Cohnella zeiphila]MBB6732508.1 type A chloramphenicol O-acetyltransferase [Cohnella zeiphila]
MIFRPIELDTWSRKPYFEHYLHRVRCTYSMTAPLDITRLRAHLKSKGIKPYPAFIHMIATAVNRHEEFRVCFDSEGRLGRWDSLSPSFTIFHEDDRTFSSLWVPYSEDFGTFCRRYSEDMEAYGDRKELAAKRGEPPNAFPVSSIPWVGFTGFNLNIYDEGKFLLPIFTMGKFTEEGGRVLLPLSVQLHHAVCDGYHAGVLFRELQELADSCADWC